MTWIKFEINSCTDCQFCKETGFDGWHTTYVCQLDFSNPKIIEENRDNDDGGPSVPYWCGILTDSPITENDI